MRGQVGCAASLHRSQAVVLCLIPAAKHRQTDKPSQGHSTHKNNRSRPGPAGPPFCREGWAGRRVRRSRWLQRRYGGAPGWGSIHPRMLPGLFRNAVPSFFFFFPSFFEVHGRPALDLLRAADDPPRTRGYGPHRYAEGSEDGTPSPPPNRSTEGSEVTFSPPPNRSAEGSYIFPSTYLIRRGLGGYFFSPPPNRSAEGSEVIFFPSTNLIRRGLEVIFFPLHQSIRRGPGGYIFPPPWPNRSAEGLEVIFFPPPPMIRRGLGSYFLFPPPMIRRGLGGYYYYLLIL